MSGFGVGSVTNIWHQILSLESTSDSVINTLGFSPGFCDLDISVRLVTNKSLGSFVNKLLLLCWNDHFDDKHLLYSCGRSVASSKIQGWTLCQAATGHSNALRIQYPIIVFAALACNRSKNWILCPAAIGHSNAWLHSIPNHCLCCNSIATCCLSKSAHHAALGTSSWFVVPPWLTPQLSLTIVVFFAAWGEASLRPSSWATTVNRCSIIIV